VAYDPEPAEIPSIFAPPPEPTSEVDLEPPHAPELEHPEEPQSSIFASPYAEDVNAEDLAQVHAPDLEQPEEPETSIFAPATPEDLAQPITTPDPAAEAEASVAPVDPDPYIDAETLPESETDPAENDRFISLLSKVQNSAQMGAPGETSIDGGTAEATAPEGPSAADLASLHADPSVAGQLGASAAWLTLVKRQHRFSRREVMEVLESVPSDQPRSLADRIKGFGKLVRSGHLVLIDDGVFALAQPQRDHFQALLDQR
jgi:hypothetical protein